MFHCSWRISLDLLDFYQEALKLRRVRVRINYRRREVVYERAFVVRTSVINPAIAPVNRYADLVCLLALACELHPLDTSRHHGLGVVRTANAADLEFVSALDLQLVSQLSWNFYEWLRNKLHVHGIVLGPIVVVLGQAIRGADNVVALFGCAVLIHIRGEFLYHRIIGLAGMKRIG